MESLYHVRGLLISLFLIAAIISLKIKAPLERLIMMMLYLQMMSNFALLSMTMPGNYMAMSMIIKPFVSLNFLRADIISSESLEKAAITSEEDLAYLG